jgi:predicted nucleotidyltransferase
MFNQATAIETTKNFLKVLKKNNNFKVNKAILYGSYALNNESNESDIDLALFSNEFSGHSWFDTQFTFEAQFEFPEVSIATYKIEDLSFNSFVQNEIIAKGIEIRIDE